MKQVNSANEKKVIPVFRVSKPKPDPIVELIAKSKESSDYADVDFGTFPNSLCQKINAATGLKINGSLKILSTYAITHTLKSHGDDSNLHTGQRSVTEEDFKLIPKILKEFDEVVAGGLNTKGKSCLLFSKKINHEIFYVVACFSEARDSNGRPQNKMFVNTMYIKK